jgi:hypothetical protein
VIMRFRIGDGWHSPRVPAERRRFGRRFRLYTLVV